MDRRRPRIRQRMPLRPLRHHELVSELRLKERVLAHSSPRNDHCWRDANKDSPLLSAARIEAAALSTREILSSCELKFRDRAALTALP